MFCLIKANSNTIKLTVHPSCYCNLTYSVFVENMSAEEFVSITIMRGVSAKVYVSNCAYNPLISPVYVAIVVLVLG